MASTEAEIDEIADLVRARVADLNNAMEKAAEIGLKIELDVRALERIGIVPTPLISVDIFERR